MNSSSNTEPSWFGTHHKQGGPSIFLALGGVFYHCSYLEAFFFSRTCELSERTTVASELRSGIRVVVEASSSEELCLLFESCILTIIEFSRGVFSTGHLDTPVFLLELD
jgi:hypothetical protein